MSAALATVAQRFQYHPEGGGGLSPAWIVEVISGIRGAPVIQHLNDPASFDIGFRQTLRYETQPVPINCRVENLRYAIEGHLSVDPDPNFLAVLLELPSV